MRRKTKTLTTLLQATTLLVRRTKSMPKSSAKLERESGLRALMELKTGLLWSRTFYHWSNKPQRT
jgi:hypothetical protein